MLTPLDIDNKKFAKQMMNGYNVEEVDDFLEELTIEYAKLYKENNELKENQNEMNTNMDKYKSLETTLQNTLVIAQKTADDITAVAKEQADQIIKDAEFKAKSTIEELNTQIMIKQKEVEDIKKQFDVYKAKMESLLISQLELLKETNED